MRKTKLFAILTVVITMLISVNASAAVYDGEPDVIEITGGLDMDKECEYTFDENRTITGRAKKGTNLVIEVCMLDKDDIIEVFDTYEIEVGISGYFSKNINLLEGKNIIIVRTDDNSSSIMAQIKRKDTEIKNKLEREYNIPGKGTYFLCSVAVD